MTPPERKDQGELDAADLAATESRLNEHMTLETVAAATGQSVNRLRAWCATGKLRCEKDGNGWTLPIVELVRVGALVAERDATFAAGHAQAFVVPIASASPDLRAEVARRLGLPAAAVTTSTLALERCIEGT